MQTRNIDGVTNDSGQKKGKRVRTLLVASFLLLGVGGLTACESEEESFESDATESTQESTSSQDEERAEPKEVESASSGQASSGQSDMEESSEADKMTSEGGGKPAEEGKKRVTPEEVNSQ